MPSCSTDFCFLDLAPAPARSYVVNNPWGQAGAVGAGSITVTSPTAWSTDWDWNRPEVNIVTSYSYAGIGWNGGVGFHYPAAETGLPLLVSALPDIVSTTAFTLALDGARSNIYDISYDIFFHTQALPTAADTQALEVMITLAESPGLESWHTPIATTVIDGYSWNVYKMSDIFYSFVINGPDLPGATLNLKHFMQYLIGIGALQPTWYLSSIEFGPEVYRGKGTLTLTNYVVFLSPPIFTLGTTTVDPDPVAASTPATITVPVTCATSVADVNLVVDVYTAADVFLDQLVINAQDFMAGVEQRFGWTWPGTATEGDYRVKVGIFDPGWTTVWHWEDDAATFTVGAPPPVPPELPPVEPPGGGPPPSGPPPPPPPFVAPVGPGQATLTVLRRARDPEGLATSVDQARDLLSRAQQIVNLGLQAVIDESPLATDPERQVYPLSLIPQAGRVIGVRSGGRDLGRSAWDWLRHTDRAWFRALADDHELWAPLGRTHLILHPGRTVAGTVTVISVKITTPLGDGRVPLEVPEDALATVYDVTEALLLLKMRTLASMSDLQSRVVSRVKALQRA